MKYKGEKVTSITGMDGKDKGEKVYADENEVEDMDEVVEKVPIENLSEVEKITPIKSLEEIKRLLPVKSIKEIANIDEVKEILPVPEDIARKFIAKHKLKHGIKHKYVSGESALPEAEVHADEYQAQAGKYKESFVDSSAQAGKDKALPKGGLEGLEVQLLRVQQGVKFAISLLDELKTSGPEYDGNDVIEGESALPQGGSANRGKYQKYEESEEGSSDEIDSVQPLSSVKPIKSIKEVKSMKEVKKIYELTDEQARMLKEMQKKFDEGGKYKPKYEPKYRPGDDRRRRRRRRRM